MQLAKAIVIEADAPLSKAVSLIEQNGVGVLVFEGKKYLGIIEERTIRLGADNPRTTLCRSAAVKTPVLLPSASAAAACEAFFSGRFKTLPVMEGSKLLGAITRWEVLAAMREDGLFAGHSVRSHMTSPILTVDAQAPISLADAMMKQSHVRRLAVLSNGHLVGLVSVFDLLKAKSGPRQRRPQMRDGARGGLNTLVSSFMKEQVETIPPEASLLQAAAAMLEKQVPALIVVDGPRPVGIITAKDIFESALYHEDERNVLVSGLSGLDKEAADAVVADGRKMLGKIGNSLPVEALAFHVKKTGKEFFVSGHIRGPVAQLRASASDYDLMGAVAMVLDELRTQALKHKHSGIERRKNRRIG